MTIAAKSETEAVAYDGPAKLETAVSLDDVLTYKGLDIVGTVHPETGRVILSAPIRAQSKWVPTAKGNCVFATGIADVDMTLDGKQVRSTVQVMFKP